MQLASSVLVFTTSLMARLCSSMPKTVLDILFCSFDRLRVGDTVYFSSLLDYFHFVFSFKSLTIFAPLGGAIDADTPTDPPTSANVCTILTCNCSSITTCPSRTLCHRYGVPDLSYEIPCMDLGKYFVWLMCHRGYLACPRPG